MQRNRLTLPDLTEIGFERAYIEQPNTRAAKKYRAVERCCELMARHHLKWDDVARLGTG
jgi:hypothetical protein